MADIKAKYILDAEDRTRTALRKAQANFRKLGNSIRSVQGLMAGLGAALSFRAVIDATARQEQALAQLEARLKSTSGVVGLSKEQIAGFAAEMQKLTTFGDEAVIEMQNLLLQFTDIRGRVFQDATKAVLNMSVAMGTDLKSAAIQVGRALNDPIKGLGALSRAGITFTDDQKEVIKQLIETGKVADAQRIVLDKLETSFGDAAATAANTFSGAMQQASNAFGDLLEQSEGLNDAKESMQQLTAVLQDPKTAEGMNKLVAGAANLAGWMAQAASETASFAEWLGEELAVNFNGVANDDIVRLREQAREIRGILEGGILNFGEKIRFFGKDGIVEYYSDAELRAELAKIEGAIEAHYQRIANKPKPDITPEAEIDDNPTGAGYSVGGGGSDAKGQGAATRLDKGNDLIKAQVSARETLAKQLEAIDKRLAQGPQQDLAEQSSSSLILSLNRLRGAADSALADGDADAALQSLNQAKNVVEALEKTGDASTGYLRAQIGLVQQLVGKVGELQAKQGEQGGEQEKQLQSYAEIRDKFLQQNPGKSLIEVDVQSAVSKAREARDAMQQALDENPVRIPVQPSTGGGEELPGYARGGRVDGPGTETSDSILSWLSRGEYVVNAKAVKRYGIGLLEQLNNMRLPRFATGGPVLPNASRGMQAATGGAPLTLVLDGQRYSATVAPDSETGLRRAIHREKIKRGGKL